MNVCQKSTLAKKVNAGPDDDANIDAAVKRLSGIAHDIVRLAFDAVKSPQ